MMKLREINGTDGGRWRLSCSVDWQAFILAVLKLGAVVLETWTVGQIGLR